jgi:DNA-binding NarL/FixJ family response regulator
VLREEIEEIAAAPLGGLSSRELEVLTMVAEGLTNTEVASGVGVSIHAVKFHLGSVYRKLGVANRTEAAAVFFRNLGPVDDGTHNGARDGAV